MPSTSSVFLNVHDMDRALRFYQGLGFKADRLYRDEASGAVRYADLSYEGAEMGLGAISSSDDPEFRAWVATPLGAGVVIYFTVDDVDDVFEKAKALGATIEFEPTDRSYGRVLGLNDPDGYVLNFIREPPAKRVAKKARKLAKAAKTVAKAAKKTARKAAKKTTRGKSPAAKSLAASRKQAERKGATTRKMGEAKPRSDRGTGRRTR